MSEFIYTKENPLRVFTSFSGYDSQCLALDRIGIPYKLVGWSEIDPFAIQAHNALYPQYADLNAGDISKINWGGNRTSIYSLTHFLAPTSQMPDCRKVCQKEVAQGQGFFGNAGKRSRRRCRSI